MTLIINKTEDDKRREKIIEQAEERAPKLEKKYSKAGVKFDMSGEKQRRAKRSYKDMPKYTSPAYRANYNETFRGGK